MRLTFVSESNRNDTKVLVGIGRRNKTMSIFCLFEFLEREYKDFFPKFLGKTDFLRGQEPIANCALVEILMSLKLCPDF